MAGSINKTLQEICKVLNLSRDATERILDRFYSKKEGFVYKMDMEFLNEFYKQLEFKSKKSQCYQKKFKYAMSKVRYWQRQLKERETLQNQKPRNHD